MSTLPLSNDDKATATALLAQTPQNVASVSILTNYRTLASQVYERVAEAAKQHWLRSDTYRDADISRIANEVIPLVQAGQLQISQLTALYLDTVLTQGTATPLSDVAKATITSDVASNLRGISPDAEYQRPGVQVWTALSKGAPIESAKKQGLDRLLSLVQTDVQLAQRWTENRALNLSTAQFWRRVPRGINSCLLCVLAATQRYHVKDLKPIHPGCQCTVAPLVLANGKAMQFDPGHVINQAVLEQLHNDVKSFTGYSDRSGRTPDYRDIQIREHGELGAVLTWRGQHFTGPDDLSSAA